MEQFIVDVMKTDDIVKFMTIEYIRPIHILFKYAIRRAGRSIILYIINNYDIDRNSVEYTTSASCRLFALKLLREHDFAWNNDCYYDPMQYNKVDTVRYLCENKCPQDDMVSIIASSSSKEVLEILIVHGLEVSSRMMLIAINNVKLENVMYLHSLGCRLNSNHLAAAVISSNIESLEIIKFLHENGCPYENKSTFFYNIEIERYCHRERIYNRLGCKTNCQFCISELLEDCTELWYLKSEIYDNVLQWLPKEMLEDTISLIK